ncbi:hypothetical protein PG994_006976 [Apiospora phragmitis]|uniref:Uncharacterized protein n=1 Tax=Apiospora phragmitis TaxID=2905665 RepID=A0ABR1V2U4_9PEZI
MQLALVSLFALAVSARVTSVRNNSTATRGTSLNPRGCSSSHELGCPGEGDDSTSTGATAGSEDDEIWCKSVSTSHNAAASNIGNMDVWLYADWHCEHEVAHVGKDGCTSIPQSYVIEAVRVLPREAINVRLQSLYRAADPIALLHRPCAPPLEKPGHSNH